MHVSYDYEKKPFGDWDNLRIVPLFPINALPVAPEEQPSDEIDLGAVRTDYAISRIRLPENFGADLPEAIHVKTPFATYGKTYKLQGGELIAEKTLVVLQSRLAAASWQQYKKFAKDISLNEESWIQLSKGSVTGAGPNPSEYSPEAAKLIKAAIDLLKTKDWADALKKLDEAKKIQPDQPFLWSGYASIALAQNKPDEMMKHCRHELELHPGESNSALFCAAALHQRGENDEARRMLTAAFSIDPSQVKVAILLAVLQADKDLPSAIATLRRAKEAVPNDQNIQDALTEYLIRNHQPSSGVAIREPSGLYGHEAHWVAARVSDRYSEQKLAWPRIWFRVCTDPQRYRAPIRSINWF
jgi:tetratricopeptide (TPR) repeat protein